MVDLVTCLIFAARCADLLAISLVKDLVNAPGGGAGYGGGDGGSGGSGSTTGSTTAATPGTKAPVLDLKDLSSNSPRK